MRVLDILNLKPRKLNHHEEVYSQESVPEATYREQELGRVARTAAAIGEPASGAAAASLSGSLIFKTRTALHSVADDAARPALV